MLERCSKKYTKNSFNVYNSYIYKMNIELYIHKRYRKLLFKLIVCKLIVINIHPLWRLRK
jgi:hypothetical protein